jgi:hypothetical protein
LALPGKFATVVRMSENRANCRNCGEALLGPYCSHCGQNEGRGDFSFGDVAGELLDEVFSWDSRLWRTLVPLVFRPGFLTAEFIAGRRARYMPPFRLYLIISFVLFLVVSVLIGQAGFVQIDDSLTTKPGLPVSPGSEDVSAGEEHGSTILTLDMRPPGIEDIERIEKIEETVIAPFVEGEGKEWDSNDFNVGISLADENSPQWLKNLDKRLQENTETLRGDPAGFIQLLTEYLPQMMFLLLPVFALLLKLCYLFSPFHYLQHLVFGLHFHSFVYLLYLIVQLGQFWMYGNVLSEAFPFVILLYLPMALMRAYGSSLAAAAGKALFIVAVDIVLLVMAFAVVVVMALALM